MEKKEENGKRQWGQRKYILIFAGILAILLILFVGLYFATSEKEPDEKTVKYSFYPISDSNIFEDPEYLGLDRSVCYQPDPAGYGMKEEIQESDLESFDKNVQLLYRMIQIITEGDEIAYENLFSNSYLKENSISNFTQQMIYHTEIRFISSSVSSEKSTFVYRLDYMIHRNNGTYRNDVGSDAIRPQFVVLNVSQNGDISIENIYVMMTQQK